MRTVQSISTFGNVLNNSLESPQGSLKISSSRFELVKNLSCFAFSQLSLPASYLHNNGAELVEDFWNWVPLSRCRLFSLRKRPFLLALRRWGRFARRNVCDSSTEFHTDDVKSVQNRVRNFITTGLASRTTRFAQWWIRVICLKSLLTLINSSINKLRNFTPGNPSRIIFGVCGWQKILLP